MSRFMFWVALLALALFVGFAAYVRLAPNDPASVHADPLVDGVSGPKAAYVGPAEAPVFDLAPAVLFGLVERVILATPGVTKVAEGPDPLHASYIARTRLMGYPDYVSLRVVPVEGGTSYAIWSRSRFGGSDLGANAARLGGWRAAIEAAAGAAPGGS